MADELVGLGVTARLLTEALTVASKLPLSGLPECFCFHIRLPYSVNAVETINHTALVEPADKAILN